MARIKVTAEQRGALVDLMTFGEITPAEVAEHLGMSSQAVRRWYPAEEAAEARDQRTRALVAMALEARTDPAREQRHMGFSVARMNYRKREAIANVRSGKMTIPEAARFARVPLWGMVGWLKLAKVPVPPEFIQPHRQPRSAEPLSRASVGNTK